MAKTFVERPLEATELVTSKIRVAGERPKECRWCGGGGESGQLFLAPHCGQRLSLSAVKDNFKRTIHSRLRNIYY